MPVSPGEMANVLILTSTGTRAIAEGFKPPFGPVDEVFIAELGSEAPNNTSGATSKTARYHTNIR